ncbi:MAG: dihydropteroate synthase [Chloroflexi bacterium]|nr:dihydropteroate synthase [Chloroflexota bacterium]
MKIGGATFEWGARTYVMGVLNITPDSFSGDGLRPENEAAIEAAVEQAVRFESEGAHILDIGGESTRPPGVYDGARSVGVQEELERVLPVIEAVLAACSLPVSIDTRKAAVARAAVAAGAGLVNDVTMLGYDPEMIETIADLGTPVVISHIRARARYDDVVGEVITDLIATVNEAEKAGVKRDRIILDPGIGFGKTAAHSLEVLRHLDELTQLGFPTLVGTSRKSSIGLVLDLPVDDRVEGTAATVALAIASGADMVRVHDVKEMARVAKMSDAIVRGWEAP